MFGNNGVMSGQVYPPPQPHGQVAANNWAGNDANTLLVVSTLITTLTYQLGCSVPGGYWQDTLPAGSTDGKQKPHDAGDPIMRDLHWQRYWVFMAASWMGFLASMMMTLSLLVRMPVDSRQVRWSFAVAYSSLVLTFNVSQSKTHISIDIIVWAVTVVFLWLMISVRPDHLARISRFFCCNRENCPGPPPYPPSLSLDFIGLVSDLAFKGATSSVVVDGCSSTSGELGIYSSGELEGDMMLFCSKYSGI